MAEPDAADRHAGIARWPQLIPDAPAVTCAGRTLTRARTRASTNRLARAFAERGVGVGDYVTIVLPNSIEWVAGGAGRWKLGASPAAAVGAAARRRIRGAAGVCGRGR